MNYSIQWNLNRLGNEPGTLDFSLWLSQIRAEFESFQEQIQHQLQKPVDEISADSLDLLIQQFSSARAQWHQAMSLVECYLAEQAGNENYRLAHGALSALKPLLDLAEHLLDQLLVRIPPEKMSDWREAAPLNSSKDFIERRLQQAEIGLPDELADFAAQMNVDGQQAWSRLYDQLSSDMRIPVMEKGEIREKSPGQIAFDSPDRSQRENLFFASQTAWQKIAKPCAAALNHLVGSRLTQDRFAKRKNHLVVPLLQNRVTEKSVEAMWNVIQEFKPILVQYLQEKQRLLGLKELNWYDLDASVATNSTQVDYQTGCEVILEAFSTFHQPMYEFAKMSLQQHWIEAEDRPGKRQGGFCIDFPTHRESRIFMTYRDTEDSLSTLAHELGHAYHTWVLRERPYLTQSYPMTLAETASTFAETIVAEQRLSSVSDPQEQLATLDRLLGDATTFLMNIHCRWIFDNELHRRRQTAELSARELCELMVESQKQAYHNALCDEGYNPTFWISKLHFYISDEPFYNFPYTFGYLLSQRLYLAARNESEGFASRYDDFLLKTTKASALDAAREAFGFDFESEHFWNEALQPIRERVSTFLKLSANSNSNHS